jgi:CDP-glucose 4,6-dehydratase
MKGEFWKGKKVFITGHTGFKGSWLTLWLTSLGADVCGYALEPPSTPSLFEKAQVARHCRHVHGDVRDPALLSAQMADFKPDIVIHMAAQALVRLSYSQPVDTYATNVMGTVNVLEAARQCSTVAAIVNVTSDKCYENREWVWGYRESDPMGGHDPYSSSKGCAELVASAYARSYFSTEGGTRLASARAGNVIGGGDWALDRLVPDIIRGFLRNDDVPIRRPDSVRPWQHVLEPLSGYMLLAEKLVTDGHACVGGWNFGPPQSAVQTVRVVTEEICAMWGAPRRWTDASDPHALHEARLLQLDSTKAQVDLGWQPRWSFREALAATVQWYKEAHQGSDVAELCLRQIASFSAKP